MDLPLVIGLLSLLVYLLVGAETLRGARRIGRLGDRPPALQPKCPPGSIIVPARNEAGAIPEALASLLALDYPDLEIIGVGAFNLLRSKVYQRCGTHRAIALEPVDDVELGRLIKENGGAQDCLFGNHSVSVKWYHSIPEMERGLEKMFFRSAITRCLKSRRRRLPS